MNNKKKPDLFEPSKSRSGPAGMTFLSSTMSRRSNKKVEGKSNNCYKESAISRDKEVIIITLILTKQEPRAKLNPKRKVPKDEKEARAKSKSQIPKAKSRKPRMK